VRGSGARGERCAATAPGAAHLLELLDALRQLPGAPLQRIPTEGGALLLLPPPLPPRRLLLLERAVHGTQPLEPLHVGIFCAAAGALRPLGLQLELQPHALLQQATRFKPRLLRLREGRSQPQRLHGRLLLLQHRLELQHLLLQPLEPVGRLPHGQCRRRVEEQRGYSRVSAFTSAPSILHERLERAKRPVLASRRRAGLAGGRHVEQLPCTRRWVQTPFARGTQGAGSALRRGAASGRFRIFMISVSTTMYHCAR